MTFISTVLTDTALLLKLPRLEVGVWGVGVAHTEKRESGSVLRSIFPSSVIIVVDFVHFFTNTIMFYLLTVNIFS